jgi:Ca2+-transporting ATPase
VVAITLMLVMIGRFLLEKLDSQDWQLQQDLSRAFEIILLGCCILVLSVPEGLPLSVTISIAYSLESMVKDGCLIRNIEVCETIGLVTDLCIDKDGLLVEDKLKANTLFSFEMEGMLEVADGLGAGLPNGSVEFKQKLGLCLMNKVCLDQSRWTRIE